MLEPNKIYLHFLLIACLATPVTASWWDDFTNNLATDLTPLIALFGEQATKQFLSESTTVIDNFIFAMAPLGILTGVVSAIRVCGSPSLRAFIGRAQEGGGIAEAELCSSTSRDVCELYHNGAIIRVFGRPKILEVVYDPLLEANEDGDKREFGINISREYFQKTILNDNRWQEKGLDDSDDEAENRLSSANDSSNDFAPNPNLSLNIGIVERSSWVYITAAIFGFFAQSSVIVLAAVVKYQLKWKKNDSTIDPWAFPFVFVGTVCVSLGMFFCATLVNDSTKERVFKRKDDPNGQHVSQGPMLYVIQPGNQVVGDQTFDPFLFSKSTNSYITSWKAPPSFDSNSGPQALLMSPKRKPLLQKLKRPSIEVSVLIATLITTMGFVFQFVGLRALHSIVSLLQLAITIMMSIVRALLRTQRLSIEANALRDRPDEVSSHELDWLALQIGKGANEPRCSWGVVAEIPSSVLQQGSAASEDKAWEYRSRLAKLTGQPANADSKLSNAWDNHLVSGRLQAQQLKKAIEDSMSIFIAHAKAKDEIKGRKLIGWSLNIATGSFDKWSHHDPNYKVIEISLMEQDSLWTVDQNLLEAIIGLWSWSIISDPRTEGESFGFRTSSASDIPVYRTIAAGTEVETEQAWRDIQFWIGTSPNFTLTSFTKESSPADDQGTNVTTIWQHYKPIMVDKDEPPAPGPLFGNLDSYQRLFGWHGIDALEGPTVGAVKINSKHIPTLCSQDIYQSFLCTVAALFDVDKEATTVTREKSTMRLEHQLITKLIESFEASGLGSKQDASLVIIPALRKSSVLPRAVKAVPTAYRIAEDLRRGDYLKEAEGVLRWAWGLISESGELQDTAMIELGELYRYACFSRDRQDFGERGVKWMELQRISSASHSANDVIDRYVSLQKRPRETRTGQDVLNAIMAREREEALWSISQLEQGNDFPIDKESGRTILSFLAQEGWFELVRTVLQVGSVVDSVDRNGRTPLSYAAEHGHLAVVAILMEANALPFTEDSDRRTPLSYAAGEGHISVMEKLLSDPRVNIYSKDTQNRSPLHWAAINGRHDAIEWLVKQGAQVDLMDNNDHTPLYAALLNNRRRKVDRRQTADLLVQLKSKTNLKIQGKEALEWALENGNFTCAEFLWEHHEAKQHMGITINLRVCYRDYYAPCTCRDMDLSVSNSQFGLKTRFLDHNYNENEVTMEHVLLAAKKGWHMAIHYVLNGLPQKEIICKAKLKIFSTLLDGLHTADGIEGLFGAAALNGSEGEAIAAILLDYWQAHIQTPIPIPDELVECVGRHSNGQKIMETLLKQRQVDIRITQAAVPVVGRFCGVEIMTLLLGHLGGHVQLTKQIVDAIRLNNGANDIMILLLNQPRANIESADVTSLIAKYFNATVVALLLSRYGENVMVLEDIASAAAANAKAGRGVMELLLDQRGTQVRIIDTTLQAAAANPKGRDIIELLLEKRGAEVRITDTALETAAANPNGREIIELLLDKRGSEVRITDTALETAAANPNGREIIELLLDKRGSEVRITDTALETAAANLNGREIIELLLDKRGSEVRITDTALEKAIANPNGRDLIELLLDKRGSEVRVTEFTVKLALSRRHGCQDIIELLLDKGGSEVQVTESTIKLALSRRQGCQDIIELLLDRLEDQFQITKEILKAAASHEGAGHEIMKLLFDRRGEQLQVTEEVLIAAAGNHGYAHEIMKLIFDRRGEQLQITEEVLIAAAGNHGYAQEIMNLFLERRGEQLQITEEVLIAAARNRDHGHEIVKLLLDRRGEQFRITEEVLIAAARNCDRGHEIIKLLLDRRGEQLRLTEKVLIAAAGNDYLIARGMIRLLLDRRGEQLQITDNVVKAILINQHVNGKKLIELLLDRRREGFQATEEMVEVLPVEWTDIRRRITELLEHQKEKEG